MSGSRKGRSELLVGCAGGEGDEVSVERRGSSDSFLLIMVCVSESRHNAVPSLDTLLLFHLTPSRRLYISVASSASWLCPRSLLHSIR